MHAQAEFGFSGSTNKSFTPQNQIPDVVGRRNGYFIGISPGLTYFMTKRLALETQLGFFGYTNDESSFEDGQGNSNRTSESSNLSFNLNSSNLFFGLSYYF